MSENKITMKSISLIYDYYGLIMDKQSISHKYRVDTEPIDHILLTKILRGTGVKCRYIKRKSKLEKLPLPCLAENKNGSWFVLSRVADGKYLVYNVKEDTHDTIDHASFSEVYNGKIVLIKAKKDANQPVDFGIKWFIPTIFKYKSHLIQVLLAIFSIQVLGIFTPVIMQVIIDRVLVHNSMNTLNLLAFVLLVITIFSFLMNLSRNYVFSSATHKIDVLLGSKMFEHLLKLPLAYFENRRVGDTVARIRELENIRRFLTGTPLSTILDLLFIFVYMFVMFIYSPQLTLVVFLTLPVFAVISLVCTPLLRKRLDEMFTAGAENQAFMVETITGIGTVKSMAIEPDIFERWNRTLANYVKTDYKSSILSGNLNAVIDLVQRACNLLILWMGVTLVMDGSLTVGQFIAFRMLSAGVTEPVLRVVQLWQEIQQVSISVNRVSDIFNAKPEAGYESQKSKLPQIKGNIKFEGVSFRYKIGGAEVLRDVDFEIGEGSIVGVTGKSGSGKSTMAKLLQRLYVPERGKILVDGTDISIVDADWLRSQIGVVMQESFLFNRTIRENIAINMPSASMDEIVKVAGMAGAHEFILEFPNGYDTQLGENGTGLSGGQKQRIAIARALMGDPKILIFDEATSSLDVESETKIQERMGEICKGRTTIIIAHRLSTLEISDGIMVFDKGRLVECGSQEELLSLGHGVYYNLYNQQSRPRR